MPAAALRAGARHFISKAVGTEVLVDVIRRVLTGDFSAPPWITPTGAGPLDPAERFAAHAAAARDPRRCFSCPTRKSGCGSGWRKSR